MTSTDTADHLKDLRPNYFMRLRKRVDALGAFVQAIDHNEAGAAEYEEGHRCVHSMISSAAIFGYPDLSAAARAAETAFETQQEERAAVIRSRIESVRRKALDVLGEAVDVGS
jgi:HPt (histidine-containing phosphotransfer) domain-containing protein